MIESPTVAYTGDIAGYKATKPAQGKKISPLDPDVVSYAAYLDSRHDAVLAKVGGAKKYYDYRYSYNGFAAKLLPGQVEKLQALPEVVAVTPSAEYALDTATTPAFLGLTDPANGLWTSRGIKGEGIIIGILDSGIWPESKSFSDRTGTNGNETQDGKLGYQQIPGWHGKCTPGEAFTASLCNQKLIGAQYFCAVRGCDTVLPHEFISPRDYNGHGTHVASTAGGNEAVPTTGAAALFGTVNGIAPRARIAAYKIGWDNGAGGAGANTGDMVAAIDQGVIDGVDVMNLSFSGTQTNYLDPVEVAFLFAGDAGVFVATSAGNSGPTASTVAHISPWLASVAAGTHNRSGLGTITLGNGATYTGASLTAAVGPAQVVLATASAAAGAHADAARQCFSTATYGQPALDLAKVAGKIVVCQRGGPNPPGFAANARVDKSAAVKEAGGVGMILWNVAVNSLNADLHSIPTVHVDNVAGPAIEAYVTGAGASATASLSQATVTSTAPAPDVASFSSRGPSRAGGGDILKPDFMAPGADILAAVAPPGNGGKDFDIYSGTSMSSPHVAGLGALLKQAKPGWSPAAMRSALATTADALSRPGLNLPFNTGSGHVRPNLSVDPGLVYDAGFNDYLAFLKGQGLCCSASASIPALDASDLNLPSIAIGDLAGSQTVTRTVTNVGGSSATYTAAVTTPSGFTVNVSPSSFTIPAGGTQTFTVTLTRTTATLNSYAFGALTWSDGTHAVRSPIAVRPVALAAPAAVTAPVGGTSYSVKFGYTGSFSATPRGLIAPATTSGTVVDDPVSSFSPGGQGVVAIPVTIAAGTTYARFELFDADVNAGSDIDLYVFKGTTQVGASGSGTSAEQVNLVNPAAGTDYVVYVHGWETAGAQPSPFKLYTWLLGSASAGNMSVSAPAAATLGATASIGLSFSGLAAGTKYLGSVAYAGSTGMPNPTIVRVDTP